MKSSAEIFDARPAEHADPAADPGKGVGLLAGMGGLAGPAGLGGGLAIPGGPGGLAGGPRLPRKERPPKLYRIGEVVDYSGLSRQTIHNYTAMGLLRESRWTNGGHRLYDESVFERLDQIAQLKAQNQSMEYIREYFSQLDAG